MGDPFYQTRGIIPVHPHSATSTIMARGVPVKAKQAQKLPLKVENKATLIFAVNDSI